MFVIFCSFWSFSISNNLNHLLHIFKIRWFYIFNRTSKMSPLAPAVNGNQTSFNQNGINERSLLERGPDPKVTYSVGALYGMRHTESRAPNLGNRTLLALISRPNFIPSMHGPAAFGQNIISSSMDRFYRDRRQNNFNRQMPAAPPRQFRNGHNDVQSSYRAANGERSRQPNHGKLNVICDYIVCIMVS